MKSSDAREKGGYDGGYDLIKRTIARLRWRELRQEFRRGGASTNVFQLRSQGLAGMDLVSSAQLSVTDVVVVAHPAAETNEGRTLSPAAERMRCTPFNVFCGKTSLIGQQICILINGKACLKMQLRHSGQAEFANGTLLPDTGVLEGLPLRSGQNHLEARILHSLYAFNSHFAAVGSIWWWPRDSRVCVVDIDGTVTISDKRGLLASSFIGAARALGAIMSIGHGREGKGAEEGEEEEGEEEEKKSGLGKIEGALAKGGERLSHGYVHPGVGEAMTAMAEHGARILYLTARPITLAHRTRAFLRSVGRHEGGCALPEGAVLTMPQGTLRALGVNHQSFKSQVLAQVRAAFEGPEPGGAGCRGALLSPFICGFGNQMTDVEAYVSAGVPVRRVFLLDKTSKVTNQGSGETHDSYMALLPFLRQNFPQALPGQPGFCAADEAARHDFIVDSPAVCGETDGVHLGLGEDFVVILNEVQAQAEEQQSDAIERGDGARDSAFGGAFVSLRAGSGLHKPPAQAADAHGGASDGAEGVAWGADSDTLANPSTPHPQAVAWRGREVVRESTHGTAAESGEGTTVPMQPGTRDSPRDIHIPKP